MRASFQKSKVEFLPLSDIGHSLHQAFLAGWSGTWPSSDVSVLGAEDVFSFDVEQVVNSDEGALLRRNEELIPDRHFVEHFMIELDGLG